MKQLTVEELKTILDKHGKWRRDEQGGERADSRGDDEMKTPKVIAWHFCSGDKLRDGKPLVVGKTYHVTGKLVMCERGLHWSRRIIDALQYACGSTICLVEAWGNVEEQGDKGVSSYRKVIAKMDATKLLRLFACDVADESMDRCGWKDHRSRNATVVARRHANGEATDAELSAARSAAEGAAEGAARSVAWSSAESAALSAAWSSAEGAAEDAARRAARSAAESAAWSAAWSAVDGTAWSAVEDAAGREALRAAWSAAESAAWSTAWSTQNDRLTTLVLSAIGPTSMEG